MTKCEYWEETKKIVKWGKNKNEPIYKTIQICNGTKGCKECFCFGDTAKCNFYPKKKKAGD